MQKYRKRYQIKKKKSIFKNRFFWLAILFLMILIGFFYLICLHSSFQVKEIKISGNQKVEREDLKKMIEGQTVKNLIFFKTKSIFLANLEKIDKVILEKFPLISQINLERKFPHTLEVQIKERKPIAIFSQGKEYFCIDKEGVIFEKVDNIESRLVKILNLTLEKKLILGERIIEKDLLSQILEIEEKLKNDLKISLNKVSIISEERLDAETSEGWEIYLNPKKDINWQLVKLGLVLKEKIPEDKRRNLEYIDLRFEKIYIFPEISHQ